MVGDVVGAPLGDEVGPRVGPPVGEALGARVGELVGKAVGPVEGDLDGERVGDDFSTHFPERHILDDSGSNVSFDPEDFEPHNCPSSQYLFKDLV